MLWNGWDTLRPYSVLKDGASLLPRSVQRTLYRGAVQQGLAWITCRQACVKKVDSIAITEGRSGRIMKISYMDVRRCRSFAPSLNSLSPCPVVVPSVQAYRNITYDFHHNQMVTHLILFKRYLLLALVFAKSHTSRCDHFSIVGKDSYRALFKYQHHSFVRYTHAASSHCRLSTAPCWKLRPTLSYYGNSEMGR
jgi:hypothetical protein